MKLVRTTSSNSDFVQLVQKLDNYLKITDGDEHAFYNQFNNIDVLHHVVVAYINNEAVGCGAFKPFNTTSVEIKRMFTKPEVRGQGIAGNILKTLETWASSLGYKHTILETGIRQVEAVSFYKKCNYQIIPNYGQYKTMENSLCFTKQLQ
ncbi:GNAT family N-acetyltransferase [Lacinutrix salivirga]